MHNFHTSVFGAHRNSTATLKDIIARYYWPNMSSDVVEYVKKCKECQLAKGTAPSKQGLLRGKHHNRTMHQLNLDLIGPISEGLTGHVEHDKPCYIFVATDPFTHMVWLETLTKKDMYSTADAFIRRILLEEGIPRVILTDNGSEFVNQIREDLMRYLRVEYGYTPAGHPRANYCERVNRFIGTTLRTLVNAPGARKKDWSKMVKYVEFAYRGMHIPGTNVSPFMIARGRQPLLPQDAELWEHDLPTAMPPVTEHVKEVEKSIKWAEKEVLRAREIAQAKSKITFDADQYDEQFEIGEAVRLYKDIPARRDPRTGEMHASKLQLKNTVYDIIDREGFVYTIKARNTGHVRTAFVAQIVRFFEEPDNVSPGSRALRPNQDIVVTRAQGQEEDQKTLWEKVKQGTHIIFQDKDWEEGVVHIGEVLRVDRLGDSIDVWYNLQNKRGHVAGSPAAWWTLLCRAGRPRRLPTTNV